MARLPLDEWSEDVSVFYLEKNKGGLINSSQIFEGFSCGVVYPGCVESLHLILG